MAIRFLVDENVPQSVADYLTSRGHHVRYVRDEFGKRTPDPLISVIGDNLDFFVVTWDKDFKKLASRMRRLGRLTFRCSEVEGAALCEKFIEHIEFHHAFAARTGTKVLMTIQVSGIKLGD